MVPFLSKVLDGVVKTTLAISIFLSLDACEAGREVSANTNISGGNFWKDIVERR